MRFIFAILTLALCVGCPTPSPTPTPVPVPTPTPIPPIPPPDNSTFSAVSQALLIAHNSERVRAGAGPLVLDARLNAAAEKHVRWMADTQNMDHIGANGSSHSDRIKAEGYQPKSAGENIAMGHSSVAVVMSDWMQSSGHRRNILNTTYTQCGFGMVTDRRGRKWWCAVFANPKLSKSDEETFSAESTPAGIIAEGIDAV